MTHSFPIEFDQPPRFDRVTLAVAPLDGLSGALVTRKVSARIAGLPHQPVQNRTGLLVFLNLPAQPNYSVSVKAEKAGYFDPADFVFTPPAPGDPDADRKRRRDVVLIPRPDFAFVEGTTLIRGMVLRGVAAVAGAAVWADPLTPGAQSFATQTSAKGEFALPLRFAALAPDEPDLPVTVQLHFSEGSDQRDIAMPVRSARAHRFTAPVDLTGLAVPDLVEA